MSEIYVSVDVETDGPIPGPHSLLSLGAAAFNAQGELLATHSVNLQLLEGADGHPETMAWWASQPDAWAAARRDAQPPAQAMAAFAAWLRSLPGKPVFVGYPVAFDFLFVHWYLVRFTGGSPFSHSALDIKTYAMALLRTPFRESTKRRMPRRWFSREPHTHVALDDAVEQGRLFCAMLAENLRGAGKG
jgi:hypothetical protein